MDRTAIDARYLLGKLLHPGWLRDWLAQVVKMATLWMFFGALIGANSMPGSGGMVDLVCGAIAGTLLMPIVGVFLGLIGCRWQEALFGGICGLAFGLVASLMLREASKGYAASISLIVGGFGGATLLLGVRMLILSSSRSPRRKMSPAVS